MITRRLFTALAAGAILSVAACGSAQTSAPGAAGVAAAAELGAAAFKERLAEPGTVILDVRSREEFAEGHLDGAINIDVEDPSFAEEIEGLNKSVPYAVYCRSGNRSQIAIDLMREAGFENTYHLAGGIGAWSAARYDVVAGP